MADIEQKWDEVAAARSDLTPEWRRVELCRRVLVELAMEFSSARYGPQAVRFRRLGLVNWLLLMTNTADEPDARHAQEMLRRLRKRELERRGVLGFMRSPGTEVALQGSVPWWAYLFGLNVLPLMWFRAWRFLGSEYRWLLRQPYMAPADPGTFAGFALRLTQLRWAREDPAQVTKVMINAFLEDLRIAYARRPWRQRAHQRTAYPVAFLTGLTPENGGPDLVQAFVEVRNETGAFDPLLLLTTSANGVHEQGRVRSLTDELGPYEAWCERLRTAGRGRDAGFWYLPLRTPCLLPDDDTGIEAQRERSSAAGRFTTNSPSAWAGRLAAVGTLGLVLPALLGTLVFWLSNDEERDRRREVHAWEDQHCGLSRDNPDAATVKRQATGDCVGVASHGYDFGSDDERLRGVLETIAEQNDEAERIHRTTGRPLVTLLHVSALFGSPAEGSNAQAYLREQVQGAASAQRRQLDLDGERDPVLRILPANAGSDMRFGNVVTRTIEGMMREDPTIVGVTGLDQSRHATVEMMGELTRLGLPMVGTTLTADGLDDESPLYYQVSPQNEREAAVAAAYADHLADSGALARRSVRVLYSADPTDLYSDNLRDDAVAAFERAGFDVGVAGFEPSYSQAEASGRPGARTVGQDACNHRGLVFFAGRSDDFEAILNGANETCGSNPPAFLGGDDVARLAANADRRGAFGRIPYEFLDFTLGSTSCADSSDLYSTMARLFPGECAQAENTSLDGHAALGFDAVNLYLKAIGELLDAAPEMRLTPGAVWQALGRIHGSEALDGESGIIDFGGVVDRQVPLDKLLSVQRVEGARPPTQVGFCGRWGDRAQSGWCPPTEAG
ncbi:hypothetical protein [Streptomyces phytophilus]|uniref:hypothetical protein n=1 Tax=Streptomyces phytophilus TaxID=722715 RepID=UPI001C68DFF3|nr:hypothetical protein [Streptomyces phytophilus]